MEPILGQIIIFAGNFAPRGWASCNGQLMPIDQYQTLYSIVGTTYGGDGRTTFALPDLRGRVLVGTGQGAALPNHTLGQVTPLIGSDSGDERYQALALNYIIAIEGIYPQRS